MKKLLFILLLLSACQLEAQRVLVGANQSLTTSQYADVGILIGQSNMSGVGSTTSPALDAQYTGALNSYCLSTYGSGTNTRNSTTLSWQRLELNKNQNNEGTNGVAYADAMGPELVLGKKMSDDKPNRVFLIKYSIVGTSLTNSSPNWSVADNTLFAEAANNSMLIGLGKITIQFGLIPKLKDIIYNQGEADSDNALTTQAEYKNQLTRVIKNIVDIADAAGYDCASTRVVIVRTHNNFSPARVRNTEVRAAQVDVATNFLTENPGYSRLIKGLTWINSDSYGLNVDLIHFNQAGQISMATDIYNYLAPFKNEYVTPTFANTSGFDTDAKTYIVNAKITSQTIANAINTFVVSAKSHTYYSKATVLYSFAGGNQQAHKLNMVNPLNSDAAYRITFGLPIAQFDTGTQGDGTTASYFDTYVPFNSLGQNTMGAVLYHSTNSQETKYSFGVTASGNASRFTWLISNSGDSKSYPANASAEQTGAANSDSRLPHILTRTSSTNFNTFIRGTKASFTVTSVATDGNTVIGLGRNVAGAKTGGTTRVLCFFGLFNQSLTDQEAADLNTDLITFQTAIGR